MHGKFIKTWRLVLLVMVLPCAVSGAELIPPLEQIKTDRPRVLLRPAATLYAVSLEQFDTIPSDAEFNQMLAKLKAQNHAAAQALTWLITGDTAAAESAIARMRAYEFSGGDTFHVYGRLTEFGLAYDWLYNYEGFTGEIKSEVRSKIMPLAQYGIQITYDHIFHNYIWMSAGGTAIWALATAGEDQEADDLFEEIRQRFNNGLFPAMEYLDGKLDILDLPAILKVSSGSLAPTWQQEHVLDLNNDSMIDILDIFSLLFLLVNTTKVPCEESQE